MKLFGWILVLIGVLLMGTGLALSVPTWQFVDRAESLPGVVVELVHSGERKGSAYYKPRVRVERPNGESVEFVGRVGSSPSAYRMGEKVSVYLDPARPDDIRLKGFIELWGFAASAGGVGTVFFLIGASLGFIRLWNRRKLARLRQQGDLVLASFDRVEIDTSTTYNDRHPWRVYAHWVDPTTGQRHVFSSEMLWQDPGDRFESQPVRVYVARGNPREYAVDLSD